MRAWVIVLSTIMGLLTWPAAAKAATTPVCDALTGPKRTLAMTLLNSQHAYACCDSTLKKCLKRKPVCRLVKRLANDICRRGRR